METQDFFQWLKENGMRTSLGPYPPSYGAGNYPPSYFTPISAGAITSMTAWHPEMLKKEGDDKPKKKSSSSKKKPAKKKPAKKKKS